MDFQPIYRISDSIAQDLMQIEAARQAVTVLSLNEQVLAGSRQSAKLISTHYSTQIEGNRLTQDEVEQVVIHG